MKEMKFVRLVVSFYSAILLGSLLALFFGDAGMVAYNRLSSHLELLTENLENLERINDDLNGKFEELATDPERIRLQARELGYFEEDEKVLTVEGFPKKRTFFEVGKVVKKIPLKRRNTVWVRILQVLIPFGIFFLSGLITAEPRKF